MTDNYNNNILVDMFIVAREMLLHYDGTITLHQFALLTSIFLGHDFLRPIFKIFSLLLSSGTPT